MQSLQQHGCSHSGLSNIKRTALWQPQLKKSLGAVNSSNTPSVTHPSVQTGEQEPQLTVSSSTPAAATGATPSVQQPLGASGSRQHQAAQFAAASGATVALALAAPSTYSWLSSHSLPPISSVAEALAGLLVAVAALLKAKHGDNVHLELHKGQLYIQLGVPKSGPAMAPGSVATRPTGDVRGNGAYATRLIPAGTHIADYEGEVLSNAEFFSRYPDGVGDYVMAIDRDNVIDASARVAATDSFHPVHMNHSRHRHNVVRYYQRSQGRVAFFASRDIQPGEELLFDYGRNYWAGREHMELP